MKLTLGRMTMFTAIVANILPKVTVLRIILPKMTVRTWVIPGLERRFITEARGTSEDLMERIAARMGAAANRSTGGSSDGMPADDAGSHQKVPSWDFGEGTIGRRFGGKTVGADGGAGGAGGGGGGGGGDGGGGGGGDGGGGGGGGGGRRGEEAMPYGGTVRMSREAVVQLRGDSEDALGGSGGDEGRGEGADVRAGEVEGQVQGREGREGMHGMGSAVGAGGAGAGAARTTPAITAVLSPAVAAAAAAKGQGSEAAAAAAAAVTSALAELEAAAPGACVAVLAGAVERLAGTAAAGEPTMRVVRDRAFSLFSGGGGGGGYGGGGYIAAGGAAAGAAAGAVGREAGAGGRSVLGDFLLARWQQDLKPPPRGAYARH